MGRKKWTTDEQEEWLSERVPDFVQSQKDKTRFFPPIYSEFHKLWPYREPVEEEIEAQLEKREKETEDTDEVKKKARAAAKEKAKAIIFKEENQVSIIFLSDRNHGSQYHIRKFIGGTSTTRAQQALEQIREMS